MNTPQIKVVIGKNYGDEGKGLCVDYLAMNGGRTLVVRHNGGAQSGHTVEIEESGKRFVFHELSSGSFRGADTFWGNKFYPDLFKLREEADAFYDLMGRIPAIYSFMSTPITIIDDVLINMAAEEKRGSDRHGSCGMGIYEAYLRTNAGFGITIGELTEMTPEDLKNRLRTIREEYLEKRLEALDLPKLELMESDVVLSNFADEVMRNMNLVIPIKDDAAYDFFCEYDTVVFESGQGLLLSEDMEENYPHVTGSNTGLNNACEIVAESGLAIDEVIYVSRSYLTRHGAGKLPNECDRKLIGNIMEDMTNLENPWQGRIRYAPHNDLKDFFKYVKADYCKNRERFNCIDDKTVVSLMVTHLNETDNCMILKDKRINVNKLLGCMENDGIITRLYTSFTKSAGGVL